MLGTVSVLFGPGSAVPLSGLHGLQCFSKVWSLWLYEGEFEGYARPIGGIFFDELWLIMIGFDRGQRVG